MKKTTALSPGQMTLRRFGRNRLGMIGLAILLFMFLFSFVGGLLTPYRQEQVFYRQALRLKDVSAVTENTAFRYTGQTADPVLHARLTLALTQKEESFSYQGKQLSLELLGNQVYRVREADAVIGLLHKPVWQGQERSVSFQMAALTAYGKGESRFENCTLSADGTVWEQGEQIGYISTYLLHPRQEPPLEERIFQALEEGAESFTYEDRSFSLEYDAPSRQYLVKEKTNTRVWDAYAAPSRAHPLGTDKNGMDMLTRLMYGGRVSLVIGFIVVGISALLGVALGGTAGYFGGWVDSIIMRLVDIFYCIPTTPVLIILGAAMDGMRVEPDVRMVFLMLVLGVLGWPGVARLVRGQILSLREQEFMTAAEAAGLRIRRRIFHHLVPNVIPQLIVTCTMSLGSTILTEATLSFLGLGVKFPFASWGNIMNDVTNAHVLTNYPFVWVPAGICLVLSVLGFNFAGDGLRDALDPRAD